MLLSCAAALDGLLQRLATATAASTSAAPPSTPSSLTPADLALASKLLGWPAAQLFPCLDVARMVALDAAGAAALAAGGEQCCWLTWFVARVAGARVNVAPFFHEDKVPAP